MTHLQALYDAVKAGDEKAMRTSALYAVPAETYTLAYRAYHHDTQAAIDFVQAVLPEARWNVGNDAAVVSIHGMTGWDYPSHGNPARALLLAALAAMIAKGEG